MVPVELIEDHVTSHCSDVWREMTTNKQTGLTQNRMFVLTYNYMGNHSGCSTYPKFQPTNKKISVYQSWFPQNLLGGSNGFHVKFKGYWLYVVTAVDHHPLGLTGFRFRRFGVQKRGFLWPCWRIPRLTSDETKSTHFFWKWCGPKWVKHGFFHHEQVDCYMLLCGLTIKSGDWDGFESKSNVWLFWL